MPAEVKAYTGKARVDIVAHSLGSSMALAMIHYKGDQGSVRRLVNIGGGIRGLQTCLYTGYQNALAPTCNAEAYVYPYNHYTFGLYPGSGVPYHGYNRWTGSGSGSMRTLPASWTAIRFHRDRRPVRPGALLHVQQRRQLPEWRPVQCAQQRHRPGQRGLRQQCVAYDWNWSDGIPYSAGGGDNSNGVGHFRSLANTGVILRNMLTTTCTTGCASGYAGISGPAVNL